MQVANAQLTVQGEKGDPETYLDGQRAHISSKHNTHEGSSRGVVNRDSGSCRASRINVFQPRENRIRIFEELCFAVAHHSESCWEEHHIHLMVNPELLLGLNELRFFCTSAEKSGNMATCTLLKAMKVRRSAEVSQPNDGRAPL